METDRKALKWALVIVPLVAAALAIYPPERKLKAGIDLAGGTSLLFEIDTSGLDRQEQAGLAERVMEVLKRRVDPGGQMNLVWRPVGNNRLEIQMPRPPKGAEARRQKYEAARAALAAHNIERNEIETMLHLAPEERAEAKKELIRGVPSRGPLLDELIEKYEAYENATDDVAAAREAYEQAIETVLRTSINLNRLENVLALPEEQAREEELQKLHAAHPSNAYSKALDKVVAAYDEWAADKGMLEDPSDLKRRISGAGVLEFRVLAERDPENPTRTTHPRPELQDSITKYVQQLHERGPRRRAADAYQWFEVANVLELTGVKTMSALEENKDNLPAGIIVEKYAGRWYVLAHATREFGLTRESQQKWKLVNATGTLDMRTGRPAVSFQLDARGGRQFAEMTHANIGRQLCIFLDNVAQSSANIESMIRQHGQITGRTFTQDKVSELVATLRAGSLPARVIPTPLMEHTVGPSLGEYNRTRGTQAAIYGGIAVAIFIIIYYLFAGVVANIALILNLLIVLAIMAYTQATFTLPGIAGLILTVGMAVDANVLIFERIREERDRGMGLRKAIRTGYERAFSTIIDANVTTLITCVVLGYVGTEEVKGFAMVLGFGVVTSMYTALFVTRLIFTTLLDLRWLKSLPMLRVLRRPQVDWLALRRVFWPVSVVAVSLALVFTVGVATTNKEALFDIEFLGGTSVQIELRKGETITDEQIRRLISSREGDLLSAVQWLESAAEQITDVQVTRGDSPTSVQLSSGFFTADQLEALVRPVLERMVERNGFERIGRRLVLESKLNDEGAAMLDVETVRDSLSGAAAVAQRAASNLAGSRIQTIQALDASEEAPMAFEVITVETNKQLVRTAILAAMDPEIAAEDRRVPRLNVERAVQFELVTHPQLAPAGYWPIQAEDRYLSDVVGEWGGNFDIRDFKGGVVIVLDDLNPPLTIGENGEFNKRVREIRLLPEYSQYEARPSRAIGLEASSEEDGQLTYSKIAYVARDPNLLYYDDPTGMWEERVAQLELEQVRQALATEKSLRRVNQFAGQVAAQTAQQAIVAIALSLLAIVAYIWIRFGQMHFGLAAIVALVHDVSITLGLVAVSHYLYNTFLGRALDLADFKIDLPMIAAFLTIIGYSLNDTIVVFDRIRENRGKLKALNPAIINNSINQCLSRTVLTSVTTFLAVAVMYIFGGPGIHGFSFALLVGIIVGTYSSVGVASPLIYRIKVLHIVVYVLLALGVFGALAVIVSGVSARATILTIAGAVLACVLAIAIVMELRSEMGERHFGPAPA